MKRLLLFAALMAWLGGILPAQNKAPKHSLDAMTRSIFERLDKRELQILLIPTIYSYRE